MTPMETARKIVADMHEHCDVEKLTADIAEALQRESNAQLDRDRAEIEAAKQTARIYHDAWSEIDGQRCEMLKKIEQQAVEITQCKTRQDFLFNELRKFAEAFKWLEKNHYDCLWTDTAKLGHPSEGKYAIGDKSHKAFGRGKTIYEAICNARTALEGEGWTWNG